MRTVKSTLAVAAMAAALILSSGGHAAELAAQKSSARGVTVSVTPVNLAAEAPSWDFRVVLDTHSGDLSDDLVKIAVLVGGDGQRHAPVAWDGAGPGGHHREGVLRFKPISPRPQTMEMQISRAGEAKPRVFRWQMK